MEEANRPKGSAKFVDFDKLWDYDHPAATEGKFRELLPAAVDSLDISYLLQLLTQIARAEGLQRKYEDANKTLDRVLQSLSKANDAAKVRYLLERGRVCNSSGKPEEARPLFLEAFELAVKSKQDAYAVDAAHMMAIVEAGEKQLQWNLKALDLAENSIDAKAQKWKGSLYNNMGWTYFDQEEFQEALYMFEKALEFREHEGDPARIRIAKWAVGKALRLLEHTEEALEMQLALFKEYEAAGERNGYVYEEIAECMLVTDQEEAARDWFAAAYAELSRDPSLANEQDRLDRLKELGKVGRSKMA